MNWNQLYASSTPEERLEVLTLMLQALEARQNKWVLAQGRLVHERRGPFAGAHIINDRRGNVTTRRIYLGMFIFIITTLSLGIWTVVIHTPPQFAAPLLFFHLAALTSILMIKPYRRLAIS